MEVQGRRGGQLIDVGKSSAAVQIERVQGGRDDQLIDESSAEAQVERVQDGRGGQIVDGS